MLRVWILKENGKLWPVLFRFALLTLTLIVMALFLIDQKFAEYFGHPDRQHIWLFHREITEIGAAEPYFILALLAVIIPKFRKKGAFLLACLLTSGLVVHIFKFIIGRARPHKTSDHNAFLFDSFNFHHHFQSLPSGHSQTLFTAATFLSFLFPKWTWAFLTFAFYFSMTRAFTLAHFVSDVLAGALIGITVTVLTLRWLVQKYDT